MHDALTMDSSFSIRTQTVSLPGKSHSHLFLELAYIRRGWTQHTLNGVSRRLRAGDVILVDFGETHSYDSGSDDLTVTNCLFQPSMIDASLGHCRSFPALLDSCMPDTGFSGGYAGCREKLFHDRDGQIAAALDRMEEECRQQPIGYYAMLRVLLIEILVQSVRLMGMQPAQRPGIEVSWITEEIRRNPAAPHALTRYAERFAMRPEALSRLFHRQTGENFAGYLRRKRIELACRLLLETDMPISEMAQACGYLDAKTFREAFHRVVGQAPRDYRKNHSQPFIRLI